MDWMRERQADAAFARGYSEQMAWLEGKTVEEAQHALISRAATLGDGDYNLGGDTATRDYIAGRAER